MIIFNDFTEGRNGINFTSVFDIEKTIKINVIDSYTGLLAWDDIMVINPNCSYFFSYPVRMRNISFVIYDVKDQTLLLKIDLQFNDNISFKDIDKFDKLKSYKYLNKEIDSIVFYSFIDIFLNKCYYKDECHVEKNDVVVDIGGNLGLFSYYSLCNDVKQIYCFEPGEIQAKAIIDNLGEFKNLKIEQAAVSDNDGEIIFYRNNNRSVVSTTVPEMIEGSLNNYEKVKVKSINIYNYFLENSIDKVNFLKIDCEGSEYKIINSIPNDFLLKSIDKIVLEYHGNNSKNLLELMGKLKNCGFNISISDENSLIGTLFAWKNNL